MFNTVYIILYLNKTPPRKMVKSNLNNLSIPENVHVELGGGGAYL